MNKTSEARLKAQKKYWENHRDYYRKLSLNEAKRVRIQRKKYKQALLDINEYVDGIFNQRIEESKIKQTRWDKTLYPDETNYILDIVNKAIGEDNGR